MESGFTIGTCYTCNQGEVYIAKAKRDGHLFLACEECFTEWPDPESFKNLKNATFETHGPWENASREDVIDHPWKVYIENIADLED